MIGILFLALLQGLRIMVLADDVSELSAEQRAAHLQRMRNIATSIKIFELADGVRKPAELVDEPVLRYTDNTRKLYDSTIWVWGSSGRPSAIMAVEYYPERRREQKWLFEIASLSIGRIAAERGQEVRWTARQPGLHLEQLADGPAPAEKPALRLAQMKKLQQRFTAYEREGLGARIELRPLARPLHRYQDDAAGVLDGAVFAFANGTNPEVLCIIEAHPADEAGTHWQFALVQMTGAEVYAQLDGKEFWKHGEADPPAERDSYINGWLATAADK
jgi:hypothetical protein